MKNGTTMRFVADAMLGRLAKWLRLLGYDTLYWRGDDARLVRLVLAENRVLLTRDTHLPPRLPPHLTLFITSDHYDKQLDQVITRLGLSPGIGCLCMRCNLPLEPADKVGLQGEIPEFVWRTQERFARCPGCLRIYWEGTHYARMMETIERVSAAKKGNGRCA
ncbi:MAG: Mut7-C RNAse domain-containing protein [candidate division NC10 bacterium]|nr:Mut7-C RNAse domain-containing protein [candidate division NC10 bacterium]MDE2321438.1 Mut7-C RNAse domain-containing protein [candidate division NC10 bacterium]